MNMEQLQRRLYLLEKHTDAYKVAPDIPDAVRTKGLAKLTAELDELRLEIKRQTQ